MSTTSPRASPPKRALVACLCAEWCGSCRDYRGLFAQLGAAFGRHAEFAWVDIEDHADAIGDPEVGDFPTLLIALDGVPVFFGAVTPHLSTAERLLQSALDGALAPLADPALAELARRVRAFAG